MLFDPDEDGKMYPEPFLEACLRGEEDDEDVDRAAAAEAEAVEYMGVVEL